jgi:hypothetical protein
MRKKLLYLIALLFVQIINLDSAYSQQVKKFTFGVSAGITAERFGVTRNFKYSDQTISSQIYNAGSWSNFGGALWAERALSSSWSLIAESGAEFVHVRENILSGGLSKSGSGVDIKETHHYVSGALYLRKYFLPDSKIRLFADLGIKADKLVRFKNEYWRYKNNVWNPSSNNINPAISLAVGIKQGRWAFSAQYHYFLGTPLDKRYRNTLDINGMETILKRQSVAIKAAYTIFK